MPKATSSWFGLGDKQPPLPYLPLSHDTSTSTSSTSTSSPSSVSVSTASMDGDRDGSASASTSSSAGSERANSPTSHSHHHSLTIDGTTPSSNNNNALPARLRHGHKQRELTTASVDDDHDLDNGGGRYESAREKSRRRGFGGYHPGYTGRRTGRSRVSAWAEKGNELFQRAVAGPSSSTSSSRKPGGGGSPIELWVLARKLLSLTLQGAILCGILAFAVYGGYMFITMRFSGRYMRIPVYTKYEIGQAGWQRPLLVPSAPSPPSSLDHPNPRLTSSLASIKASSAPPTAGAVAYPPPSEALLAQTRQKGTQVQVYDFDTKSARADGRKSVNDLHVLILTPLKNAVDTLDNFFALLSALEHPKENLSLGFLLGDEEDATGEMINAWVGEQEAKGEYRKISLLRKDFGMITPGGDARHKNWLQAQRRSLMAKARTLLLTSTLEPSVDWVLWLDSDLHEAPRSMIADLLYYGHAGVFPDNYDNTNTNNEDGTPLADVITPNIMRRLGPGQIQGYDLNNWAETPQSLKMKAKLPADRILHEGQQNRPTHRTLLARSWVPPNITSTWNDNSPYFPYMPEIEGPTDLYDPSSEAYIGRTTDLDGVGGVATLVRAETHRFGAVFPSWVQDHQVETEGFGVMARQTGARIVGLQNYLVYHYFAEYGMLGI